MAKAIHLKLEIGPKDPSNCDSFELAGRAGGRLGPQKGWGFWKRREEVPSFKNMASSWDWCGRFLEKNNCFWWRGPFFWLEIEKPWCEFFGRKPTVETCGGEVTQTRFWCNTNCFLFIGSVGKKQHKTWCLKQRLNLHTSLSVKASTGD